MNQPMTYPTHLNPMVNHQSFLDEAIRQLHDTAPITTNTTYTPELYHPSHQIIRTHLLPRFGFPKNIGVLWEGNYDEIETYIIGICVGSLVILGVMTVCLLVMGILRIVGYRRVGFWGGCFELKYDSMLNGEDGVDDGGEEVEDGTMNSNMVNRNFDDDEVENSQEDDEGIIQNNQSDREVGNSHDIGHHSMGHNTGLIAMRRIGFGEFNERNSHVSIVIEKATANLPDTNLPANKILHRIEDDPNINNSETPVDETRHRIADDDDDPQSTIIVPNEPNPELNGFRLKVARIDPNGQIVALLPKPVPESLYLKVNAVRICFILFGIGAIISSGLFYGLGVKRFEQSLRSTKSGITNFNALAYKSIYVTDNLLDVLEQIEDSLGTTEKAMTIIISFCELDSFFNETLFLQQYEIVKDQFIMISDTIKRALDGFGDNMRNIIEATTMVHDRLDMANVIFAFMVLGMCIMIILIFIMIIGVAFAAYEVENCFTCFMRRVVLLPIFVLQVVLATIFSALFFTGALGGSDFCISPDYHAKRMLSQIAGGASDSLSPLFVLMLFYMSGCKFDNDTLAMSAAEGFKTIQDIIDAANYGLVLAHDLFDIYNNVTRQDILLYCSVNIPVILYFDAVGGTMHTITHQLHDALEATLEIISCASVYPVYSDLVHNAVCIGAVGGIEAIFTTMISISVLSMIMLALRAALYPIQQSN